MGDVEAHFLVEVGADQMVRGADSRRGVAGARMGFCPGDQLRQGGGWDLGVDRDDVGLRADESQRGEILQRVVGQLAAMQEEQDRMRRGRSETDRVAVGRCAGASLAADDAGAAGLVFNHDRRAQRTAQRLGKQARHDVGGTAGCIGDHQADRLVGIGLLRGSRWNCLKRRQCRENANEFQAL
jgi:hypothetical protein